MQLFSSEISYLSLTLSLIHDALLGGFALRERQNSKLRVEITAVDNVGSRRRLACKNQSPIGVIEFMRKLMT
jgi:hypothetical protein